ncbi:MAG: diphosphomevalonate decarboxylase [Lacticaseibacillus songhuajiangensis]|nr:diphosphomevalonate decarboxylase [Lacticaseibacillus songhuajiangensis]
MKASARAHTNIALIKYWGKADADLMLPANSSISMTLDKFYTDTTVEFVDGQTEDSFVLDGQKQDAAATAKVGKILDLVRQMSDLTAGARVSSQNHVPNAAGLASSASAFAALALAASRAAGLNLDDAALSRLARRGSGSASRSIAGGFVIWHRGHDDLSSFAEPLPVADNLDLRMVTVLIDKQQKKVSSRSGMAHMAATSPYFAAWTAACEAACPQMATALAAGDFVQIGALAERNALMMHATNMAANPPFMYFEPATIATLQYAAELRAQGLPVYATMDAGPNVKLLCQATDADKLAALVSQRIGTQTEICAPGPEAHLLEED